MNTRNWQIKILTFCMAAFALCLTVACGDEYTGPERITPSAPCGDDVPLTPSVEYITLEGAKVPRGYEKSLEAAKNPGLIGIEDAEGRERFINSMRAIARAERLRPERHRVQKILDKYRDRILRNLELRGYGYSFHFGVDAIDHETGLPTDKMIIRIQVNEYVEQSTLPPEDRIPECMEGVPVHYIVR